MQQSGNDNSELKKLVDEVKELHTKYQKLQIRVGQVIFITRFFLPTRDPLPTPNRY
jgi:hypothetical protein